MTDHAELIERLRVIADLPDLSNVEPKLAQTMQKLAGEFTEAADALSALVVENARLREALERLLPEAVNDRYVSQSPAVENARAALAQGGEKP